MAALKDEQIDRLVDTIRSSSLTATWLNDRRKHYVDTECLFRARRSSSSDLSAEAGSVLEGADNNQETPKIDNEDRIINNGEVQDSDIPEWKPMVDAASAAASKKLSASGVSGGTPVWLTACLGLNRKSLSSSSANADAGAARKTKGGVMSKKTDAQCVIS